MHITGTANPNKIELLSATTPINRGINAPPIIAVIIKPESSLALFGILSTVIEKTRGKIFAKPKPPVNIQIIAMVWF